MNSRQSKALALILFMILFTACATSPEKARKTLEDKNISYSADTFVQTAGTGDTETVKTFLIAGMDPNSVDKEGNNAVAGKIAVIKK